MELQGRIIAVMPERSGVSARGEWKTQDYVIETHDAFPRKMMFNVFGAERIQRFNIQVGQEVIVSFDIDAREYNGRWYNDVRAYNVRQIDQAAVPAQHTEMPQGMLGNAPVAGNATPVAQDPFAGQSSVDDLPF